MINLCELRDSAARAFPADAPSPSREDAWQLVGELGWLLVELAETDGGLGLSREGAAAIVTELGAALSPAPVIPALLGLRAIAGARSFTHRGNWIERICGGAYVPLNLLPAALELSPDGMIRGRADGLLEADIASHAVIDAGDSFRVVHLDAPGLKLERIETWDETRRVFALHFDGFHSEADAVLAEGMEAEAVHDDVTRSAHLLLAADSLGGARAALAMTVDYLKVRRQFDRPLAMFQALKHRCADLEAHTVAADTLLWERARDADSANPTELCALKALATDVYSEVAEEAIQLHGGIGLTMEHPCHRFLKRALLNATLCGDADEHFAAQGRRRLTESSVD